MSLQDFLNIEFAGEDLTKIADPDLVPEGTHTFEILQGYAPKETKSGGVGLSIGCREVTGKGIVNLWINLRHPNPTVVKIGKETLIRLGIACGVDVARQADGLAGCRFEATVKHREAGGKLQADLKNIGPAPTLGKQAAVAKAPKIATAPKPTASKPAFLRKAAEPAEAAAEPSAPPAEPVETDDIPF